MPRPPKPRRLAPDPAGRPRCALCRRALDHPITVAGVGVVGSECHGRVAGIERLLALAAGIQLGAHDDHAHLVAARSLLFGLKALGYEVSIRPLPGGFSSFQIGSLGRQPKLMVQTYEERRLEFEDNLKRLGRPAAGAR